MARYIDADIIDFSPLKNDFDRARAQAIIMYQPTEDVVPREMFDQLKAQLEESRLEKAGFEGAAKQMIEGLKAEVEKYRAVCEYDIREYEKENEKKQSHEFTVVAVRAHGKKEPAEAGADTQIPLAYASSALTALPKFEEISSDGDLPF